MVAVARWPGEQILLRLVLAATLAGSCAGCGFTAATEGRARPPSLQVRGPNGRPALTQAELSALLQAFADTYALTIGHVSDDLAESGLGPRLRTLAQQRKVAAATRAYAIAAEPNPEIGLVDMVVNVSLERALWSGGLARRTFGEQGSSLAAAYDDLHRRVWALAARVFSTEQRRALENAIQRWLAEHPDARDVGYVRFDALAPYRTEPLLDIGAPGGPRLLAPVSEALRTAEALRLLGERAIFLFERMPMVAGWQGELVYLDMLDDPEPRRLLADMSTLAGTAHRAAALAERMTSPEALSRSLSEIQGTQDSTSALLREATGTLDALQQTVTSTDELLGRLATPTPDGGRGTIDVRAYTDAIKELRAATRELNQLVQNLNALAGSTNAAARLDQIERATATGIGQVGRQGEDWIDHFFTRALLFVAGASGLLVSYRLLLRRIGHGAAS